MPKTTTRRKKITRKSTRKKTPAGHKKVVLTCEDRLFLLESLPAREGQATLRIMRKLRERLALSEAEIDHIEFTLAATEYRPRKDRMTNCNSSVDSVAIVPGLFFIDLA